MTETLTKKPLTPKELEIRKQRGMTDRQLRSYLNRKARNSHSVGDIVIAIVFESHPRVKYWREGKQWSRDEAIR